MRRAVAMPCVIAAAVAVVACGDSAVSTTPGSPGPGAVNAGNGGVAAGGAKATALQLKGTMTLSGAVSGSQGFTVSLEGTPSCAEYATTGSSRGFLVPSGGSNGLRVAGHAVVLIVAVTHYRGEGGYTKADFADPATQTVRVDTGSPFTPLEASADEQLTVRSDGSGDFRFEGWKAAGRSDTLSGEVTWTCGAG